MKKILLIEDEESLRANFAEMLTLEDFYVIEAANGHIGLDLAQEHIPDLIICDVMMPELDGYGVLTKLRQNPATATIPFIFTTAKATQADLRKGMELGADDYVTKPFTIKELLNAISTQMEKAIAEHKRTEVALHQSETRFARMADNVPGMIYQWKLFPDGILCFPYVSSGCRELYELEASQIQENPELIFAMVAPDHLPALQQAIAISAQTLENWEYEWRSTTPSGKQKWLRGISKPERQLDGSILWDGCIIDISERKQAEELLEARVEERTAALRQSEARLQRLADNVPGMIYEFRLDPDGRMSFPFVSSGCREVLGIEPEQLCQDGALTFTYIHPEDISNVQETITRSALTLQNCEYECRIITPSNQQKWIKAMARPERQPGGEILWYGCLVDISEAKCEEVIRKQTQQQLQEQAQFLQSIWEGVDYGIFVLDVLNNGAEFRYASFNPGIAKTSPILVENLLGKTMNEALPNEMADIYRLRYRECVKSGKSIFFEEHFYTNGKETWWELNATPLLDCASRIYQIVITATEITERKQAEQERQMFVSLIENSSDFIGFATLEGKPVFLNEAGQKLVGIDTLKDKDFRLIDFIYPEDRDDMQQRVMPIVMERGMWQEEYRFRHFQSGEPITVDYNMFVIKNPETGEPSCLATITRDIRKRKQAEIQLQQQAQDLENTLHQLQRTQAQLIQNEKMSSLGNMVAGVAHEINNPVNFIHGNLVPASEYTQDLLQLIELYEQHYPNPPKEIEAEMEAIDLGFLKQDLIKLLQSMRVGTQRIREIVLSLRNFSRLDEAEFKQVDIHEGIDSTLMILHSRLKAKSNHPDISVIKEYGELPVIECYPGQLNQVFMNILSNAIDALDDSFIGHQGQIRIRTEVLDCNQVVIRISDNGLGIPQEIVSKLFDPFFTTKDVGKGTGLGLSISYQIVVDKHGGELSCQSTVGQGAKFVIKIPITQTRGC